MTDDLLYHHLDKNNRLILWPSKPKLKAAAREYLASKFQPEREYTEREVNDVLNRWHVFSDAALLRRELIMHKFLDRTPDGSAYWRTPAD